MAFSWQCLSCTFLHSMHGNRCQMCGELRVSRQEMRDFVAGRNVGKSTRPPAMDGANGDTRGSSSTEPTTWQDPSYGVDAEGLGEKLQSNSDVSWQMSALGDISISNGPIHRAPKLSTASFTRTLLSPASATLKGPAVPEQPYQAQNQKQRQPYLPPTADPRANPYTSRPVSSQTQSSMNASESAAGPSCAGADRQPNNAGKCLISSAGSSNAGDGSRTGSFSGCTDQRPVRQLKANPYQQTGHRRSLPKMNNPYRTGQQNQRQQQQQSRLKNSISQRSCPNQNAGMAASSAPSTGENPFSTAKRLSESVRREQWAEGPVPIEEGTKHHWIYPETPSFPLREYQFSIAESAIMQNTLVSLPTGLGKTLVAAVVMYNFYNWFPTGKVIFCAPTRPLVTQQIEACYGIMGIPTSDTAEISARTKPESRACLWGERRVFFCTPQSLQKDIAAGRCEARSVVCIILDEAHRAQGDYDYTKVVEQIEESGAKFRVVGLSATPGTSQKAIQEVVQNLRISKIEARTDDDEAIKKYIHKRESEIIQIKQTNAVAKIERLFAGLVNPYFDQLRSRGVSRMLGSYATATDWNVIQAKKEYVSRTNRHDLDHVFGAVRRLIDAKVALRTHGIGVAKRRLQQMQSDASGLLSTIVRKDEFLELWEEIVKATSGSSSQEDVAELKLNNPKLCMLDQILIEHFSRARAANESSRCIVFAVRREPVEMIVSMLSASKPLIRPHKFVGQSTSAARGGSEKDSSDAFEVLAGMKQREQQEALRLFKKGDINVIVCTSIGEEGLDIGEVDLIVNFDCLRSPIRMIQRNGRTGRKRDGRVVTLISEGAEAKRYQASMTDQKRLGRLLKDASTFKFIKQSRMFATNPTAKRQNMDVRNEYRLSQVGGHSQKKKKMFSARHFVNSNDWRLRVSQEEELGEHFASLTQTDRYYDSSQSRFEFPKKLRRDYLNIRQRYPRAHARISSGTSSSILKHMEDSYLKDTTDTSRKGINRADEGRAALSSGHLRHAPSPSVSPLNVANDQSSLRPSSDLPSSSKTDGGRQEGLDIEEFFLSDTSKVDAPLFLLSDDADACAECGKHPEKEILEKSDSTNLDELFGSVEAMSIHEMQITPGISSDCLNAVFDEIDNKRREIIAPPRFDKSTGTYFLENHSYQVDGQDSLSSPLATRILDCRPVENIPNEGGLLDRLDHDQLPLVPAQGEQNIRVAKALSNPTIINADAADDVDASNLAEIHVCIKTDSSSCESDESNDKGDNSKVVANGSRPKLDEKGMEAIPIDGNEAHVTQQQIKESQPNVPDSVYVREVIENDDNGFKQGHDVDDGSCGTEMILIATQDSSSSSSEGEDSSCSEKDGENDSHKSIIDAKSDDFGSGSSNEAHNKSISETDLATAAKTTTKEDMSSMPPPPPRIQGSLFGDAETLSEAMKSMSSSDDTPIAIRLKPHIGHRRIFLSPEESTQGQTIAVATSGGRHVRLGGSPMSLRDTPVKEDLGEERIHSVDNASESQDKSGDDCVDFDRIRHQRKRRLRRKGECTNQTGRGKAITKKPRGVRSITYTAKVGYKGKTSKRDLLKQRVNNFFDEEAGVLSYDEDSGDAAEESELLAIEADEQSHDSFINDSSQLGRCTQDDLDLVFGAEKAVPCTDVTNASVHRALDIRRERENQFSTPIFNRRQMRKAAESTPSSAHATERGLGSMEFIRSVLEHHKAGGEADAIEGEYQRLATANPPEGTPEEEFHGNPAQPQKAGVCCHALVAPTVPHHSDPLRSNARPFPQHCSGVVNGVERCDTVVSSGKSFPPPHFAPSRDAAGVGTHTRPQLRGSSLSDEQKAMIELKRQEALRRKEQKLAQKIKSNIQEPY